MYMTMSAGNKKLWTGNVYRGEARSEQCCCFTDEPHWRQRVRSCDEDEGRYAGRHGVSRSVHAN